MIDILYFSVILCESDIIFWGFCGGIMAFLPDIGDTFSGCQIVARIGQGAFGVVYLAVNPLGQKVVIKIVTTGDNSSREMKGLRNYMTVAGSHPNLMRIFHIGEAEAGFYYVMEAADDHPLMMP